MSDRQRKDTTLDKFVRIFTLPDGTQAAAGPFHYPAKADEFGNRLHTEGLAVDRGSLSLHTHAALERQLRATRITFDPDAARCRVCGCTEDAACIGGCQWATDAQQLAAGFDPMVSDLCTRCLEVTAAPDLRDAVRALCRAIRTGEPVDFAGRQVPAWFQDIVAAELTATVPPAIAASRAEAEAAYPPHVIEAGGPDHYAAQAAQALDTAILAADWDTVRQVANDPYADGDDRDKAAGALAGACQPAQTGGAQ